MVSISERTEARDQRERDTNSKSREFEVSVIERGDEVRGVPAGGHGVLEVVILARVGVREIADIADERGIRDACFNTVGFGRVGVVGAGLNWWVLGFDGGGEAAGLGVYRKDRINEGVKFGVGLDVAVDEEFGFIGYVAEDERSDILPVIASRHVSRKAGSEGKNDHVT